jgi:outer membrane protein TolC
MKHFNWLFFLVFSILPSLGFGQDTLLISKADILQKISSQNLQLKISNEDFKSAKADYKQSNSLFLPNLSVSHTGILTTNVDDIWFQIKSRDFNSL